MNIALPRTRPGHKAPYFAGVFAALSIVAVSAGIGIWQATNSGDAGPAATSIASPSRVASLPSVVFYVVDSDAQAEAVLAGAYGAPNEYFGAGYPDPELKLFVFKATTPEEENTVMEAVDSWMAGGSVVQMFDARGR